MFYAKLYKPGDVVVIVDKRTENMNHAGRMDKYLGTEMTVKSISGELLKGQSCYHMIEDGGMWSWSDEDIIGLAKELIPDDASEQLFGLLAGENEK